MMNEAIYSRAPGMGPDCSAPRSARLRERRFDMAYEHRAEPSAYRDLAEEAKSIFLRNESVDPALARAMALRKVVEACEIDLEADALFLGGENPFFFNLLLPALQADRHSREGQIPPDPASGRLRDASVVAASCFEGHITPGLEFILGQGIAGIRERLEEGLRILKASHAVDPAKERFFQAGLLSCETVLLYAERYREEADRRASETDDESSASEWRKAARILERVPELPARTFREALQSYWIVYALVTLEMGGCCPGGGLGLGRLDQFLYPYYRADLDSGRLTRDEALELMEQFLLQFRHVDYYTDHQLMTPGSQASLGGVTPAGLDASNDLTELILEASLRIAMPAPYLSLRLHRDAPERFWKVAASYVLGGLGFPVVNDEALIPAMLKHGRSLYDARDYICSCCYENTIPGREAFHPNGSYLNLAFVLELALNGGRSLLAGEPLGAAVLPPEEMTKFEAIERAFRVQAEFVIGRLVEMANASDRSHSANRRYPLMSLFIDDCIAKAADVCAGGARYNLTGCIVSGLPNVVNSLAAIRLRVFEEKRFSMTELIAAMRTNFEGFEPIRRLLLSAPKWGNGDDRVDDLARSVTDHLYETLSSRVNARGGRWQMALYSFLINHRFGEVVGASADGRPARESLTRNLNPTWGTEREGPTGVLRSLSRIDFAKAPDGCSLDLKFDPSMFKTEESREKFASFLKTFVSLGVMEMQISMADTETLQDAQRRPERYPHLMVRVAGYSGRFIDLPLNEQSELINRTAHGGA